MNTSFLKTISLSILIIFLFEYTNAQKLAIEPYVSGVDYAIDIKNCGDNRLFVGCQNGKIFVINPDGTLRTTPFLNITSKVFLGPEDGLEGFCFSPNYKTDGKLYINYTAKISGQVTTVIEEYKVNAADSNLADISSALTILTQTQPYDDHVGGNMMFGKDGYLLINFGDGDAEEDPNGYGQDMTTFLGKILRIDISNSSLAQPYVVPSTNAYYNNPDLTIKKEIWASGVRNPFRSSIDRITGDYWIADVGQYSHEEVDYQTEAEANGKNYGWNIMEGSYCFKPATGCNTTGLTLPIYDYPHPSGGSGAIIGGYVYRSAQSKALFGTYIFTDFVERWIHGLNQVNGIVSGSIIQYDDGTNAPAGPISFGEDYYGDQYILYNGIGTVYKITDTSYQRRPKAYFTSVSQNGGASYLLQGLQGVNLSYQWLNNNVPILNATSPDYTVSSNGLYTLVVTNSLGISDTSDAFPFGSLPVNLISFTAQKISNGNVSVQWKTATEQNIIGFTVLRKLNSDPDFSDIGFVQSKAVNGSSGKELDYTFIDSSAQTRSQLYYRLQIQNKDGSFTYSDIRIVPADTDKINFTFYPNPAKDILQVYIDGYNNPLFMSIYNNLGQKVKEQLLSQQNTSINVQQLRGIYFVVIKDKNGNSLSRKKLVIQ